MYGIALLPLMDLVNEEGVLQKWYADAGNAAGSIESLRNLFEKLKLHGPAFGYNVTNCHLITKDSSLDKAKDLFKDENVELVGGHCILGSDIGLSEACHAFQSSKLTEYADIVNRLASHAKKSPQNVYHAFTKGVHHKLTFLSRTTPNMENTLQNTESLLTTKLIPNVTGRGQPSVTERRLFALPLSKGGLNIFSPEDRRNDLQWSKAVTSHLDEENLTTAEAKQHATVNMIKKQKQEIQKLKLEAVNAT